MSFKTTSQKPFRKNIEFRYQEATKNDAEMDRKLMTFLRCVGWVVLYESSFWYYKTMILEDSQFRRSLQFHERYIGKPVPKTVCADFDKKDPELGPDRTQNIKTQ